MKRIRVLAGALAEFEGPLRSYIETQSDLILTNCVDDGEQLLEELLASPVDVVVVELLLCRLDALGVLEQIPRLGLAHTPRVVVVSPVGREVLVRNLLEAGTDYCLLKPVSMVLLGARIRQLVRGHSRSALHSDGGLALAPGAHPPAKRALHDAGTRRAASLLAEIGISSRINGYQFLARAIDMVVENEGLLGAVTKVLYPAVAREFGSTPSRVERSIRHAIERAWGHGNREQLSPLFEASRRGKPSNSEFIAVLADRLQASLGGDR